MTKKKSIITQEVIVGIVLVALYLIFRTISSDFGKYTTFLSMMDISYYTALMAIGVAFPLITGGVDLSIGTGMICYALAGGALIRFLNCPTGLAILVSILFGVLIGLCNGVLISVMGLPPFLATLCNCMITRGLGSVVTGSFAIPWPTAKQDNGWFHSIFKITLENKTKIPLGLLWVILLMLVMQFVLAHTRFGRYTIAIGSNKEAAILSGMEFLEANKTYYALFADSAQGESFVGRIISYMENKFSPAVDALFSGDSNVRVKTFLLYTLGAYKNVILRCGARIVNAHLSQN